MIKSCLRRSSVALSAICDNLSAIWRKSWFSCSFWDFRFSVSSGVSGEGIGSGLCSSIQTRRRLPSFFDLIWPPEIRRCNVRLLVSKVITASSILIHIFGSPFVGPFVPLTPKCLPELREFFYDRFDSGK